MTGGPDEEIVFLHTIKSITHLQWPYQHASYYAEQFSNHGPRCTRFIRKKGNTAKYHFDISALKGRGFVPERIYFGTKSSRTGESATSSYLSDVDDLEVKLILFNTSILKDISQHGMTYANCNLYVFPKLVSQRSHPELCLYNTRNECKLSNDKIVSGDSLALSRGSVIEAVMAFHGAQMERIAKGYPPFLLAGFFISYVCNLSNDHVKPCIRIDGPEWSIHDAHHTNIALVDYTYANPDGSGIRLYCYEPHPAAGYHEKRRPANEVRALAEFLGVPSIGMIHGNQSDKNSLCAIYGIAFLISILEGSCPTPDCTSRVSTFTPILTSFCHAI